MKVEQLLMHIRRFDFPFAWRRPTLARQRIRSTAWLSSFPGGHQRSVRMKSTTRCARGAAATSIRRSSTWQFSTRLSARSCCDDQYGLGITPTAIEDIAKHLLEADVLRQGTAVRCFNRLPLQVG